MLTDLILCHHLIMCRIADNQQMCFLWLCYEAKKKSAKYQCDQIRKKRLLVFVVVPDAFMGSTQLRRNFSPNLVRET